MPNIYRATDNVEYREYLTQNNDKKKKKKKSFKELKGNTIKSLNEVEYFLTNIKTFSKHIKVYKMFKK